VETIKRAVEVNPRFQFIGLGFTAGGRRVNDDRIANSVSAWGANGDVRLAQHRFNCFSRQFYQFTPVRRAGAIWRRKS